MVCLRRLYCIRVLTCGVFKEVVLYQGTHTRCACGCCTVLGYSHTVCLWMLYCIRVLTCGVFTQILYEERVFVLY